MPGADITNDSGVVNRSVSLSGVTGVRIRAAAQVSSSGGPSNDSSDLRLYEIQAFGPGYVDSGARIVNGATTYAIGCETPVTASHKLRAAGPNGTVGIPLLATDDPLALPLRIYDGSAVKALPKANI